MKSLHFFSIFLVLVFAGSLLSFTSKAQRAAVRQQIERDMEKKYADSQRIKGRKELKKITYENDKRYKDPKNKVQATIAFETKEFNKKGEEKKYRNRK